MLLKEKTLVEASRLGKGMEEEEFLNRKNLSISLRKDYTLSLYLDSILVMAIIMADITILSIDC